jgi:hypothetical protein
MLTWCSSFQRVVPAKVVGESGRDVVGSLIQSFVVLLGVAQSTGFGILLHLGPQALIRGPHLTEDIAVHLRGQAKLRSDLLVVFGLQAFAITRLARREGLLTHPVQGVPVRQLRGSQGPELVRRGGQLQFGSQRRLHERIVL